MLMISIYEYPWDVTPGNPGNSEVKGILHVVTYKPSFATPGSGGFLKWWYPTTMGFPTKSDHFGVFWGYHHFRKPSYIDKSGPVFTDRVSTAPGRFRHSWKSAMVVVIPTENINKPNLNGSFLLSFSVAFWT